MTVEPATLNADALAFFAMLSRQWRGRVHSIPTPVDIGPEARRLVQRAVSTPGQRILSLSITTGPEKPSFEDVCREINSAFDQERDGRASFNPPESEVQPVDIREILSQL